MAFEELATEEVNNFFDLKELGANETHLSFH